MCNFRNQRQWKDDNVVQLVTEFSHQTRPQSYTFSVGGESRKRPSNYIHQESDSLTRSEMKMRIYHVVRCVEGTGQKGRDRFSCPAQQPPSTLDIGRDE